MATVTTTQSRRPEVFWFELGGHVVLKAGDTIITFERDEAERVYGELAVALNRGMS